MYNKSDVYTTTGQYPLVFGYDFAQYLMGQNWTDHAIWAYQKGAVITVGWLAENPLNGESASNCSGSPVTAILPGGTAEAQWIQWMDRIVQHMNNFKDESGDLIPVVVRIFREPNEPLVVVYVSVCVHAFFSGAEQLEIKIVTHNRMTVV